MMLSSGREEDQTGSSTRYGVRLRFIRNGTGGSHRLGAGRGNSGASDGHRQAHSRTSMALAGARRPTEMKSPPVSPLWKRQRLVAGQLHNGRRTSASFLERPTAEGLAARVQRRSILVSTTVGVREVCFVVPSRFAAADDVLVAVRPSGQAVPPQTTSVRSALRRSASNRLVPVRSAILTPAHSRGALVRMASVSLAMAMRSPAQIREGESRPWSAPRR